MKTALSLIGALALAWLAVAQPARHSLGEGGSAILAVHPFSFWKPAAAGSGSYTATYASDGDTNGACYFAGKNYTAGGTWTNPHTAGYVVVTRSSAASGGPQHLVDRGTTGNSYTNNVANSWAAIDFGSGRAMTVNVYSLQAGNPNPNAMRNWKLQGSNNAASNSVANLAAATWTDLETRSGDTTMAASVNAWGTYTLGTAPSAYRWLRILQNGTNSSGDNYLFMMEFEFYGTLTY